MSLNSIQLSQNELVLLYKNSLVDLTNGETVGKQLPADQPFKFLGGNKKNVLVVVHYPEAAHLPDRQLTFLTRLLAACHLHLGDVAILNFFHHNASEFNSIISFFKPKSVLLFGTEPATFGTPLLFPAYQVQAYQEAVYLFTPALGELENDKLQKSKLWVCLKKIFNL